MQKTFALTYASSCCAVYPITDGIHILVNLNSHTSGERNGICALKPAPVQMV